ncbi:MAG: DNA-directed RNA polymerase subunit omega [Candidatus Omnitrophica bacterium]|jgi:DNA-directed RNA polymerase omega subunit|nr:DNA-directed RNA polymerase subunit omega [Candidatus Omnitrophota bacterium]MDD5080033.1 DNA-directed RNA polymerase subunit omega [Candidatus Omnitrophota bacterium]
MEYVALEKLLDKSGGSLYKLVVLASKRALDLAEGKPRLVENVSPNTKPSIIALQEISDGMVKVKG